MNPDRLRTLPGTAKSSDEVREILFACADQWEADRDTRAQEATEDNYRAEIAELKAKNDALRERVEEAERQNAILRCHLADIDKTLDAALASQEVKP